MSSLWIPGGGVTGGVILEIGHHTSHATLSYFSQKWRLLLSLSSRWTFSLRHPLTYNRQPGPLTLQRCGSDVLWPEAVLLCRGILETLKTVW